MNSCTDSFWMWDTCRTFVLYVGGMPQIRRRFAAGSPHILFNVRGLPHIRFRFAVDWPQIRRTLLLDVRGLPHIHHTFVLDVGDVPHIRRTFVFDVKIFLTYSLFKVTMTNN